jgi:hypothetical protein
MEVDHAMDAMCTKVANRVQEMVDGLLDGVRVTCYPVDSQDTPDSRLIHIKLKKGPDAADVNVVPWRFYQYFEDTCLQAAHSLVVAWQSFPEHEEGTSG